MYSCIGILVSLVSKKFCTLLHYAILGDIHLFIKCECITFHFRKEFLSLCLYVLLEYRYQDVGIDVQFLFVS